MVKKSPNAAEAIDRDTAAGIYSDADDNRYVEINEFDMNNMHPLNKDDLEHGVKIFVIGKPGCLAPGTQVLLYNGTCKAVETITTNDILMGDDNKPRNVLATASGEDEMFKIVPVQGRNYTVNKKHILTLRASSPCIQNNEKCSNVYYYDNTGHQQCKTFYDEKEAQLFITTIPMVIDLCLSDYLKLSPLEQANLYTFHNQVEFKERSIAIDPALLGYWLADKEGDIVNEYASRYFPAGCSTVDVEKINELTAYIKTHNLIHNKHIPHEIKNNSRKIRLQLLAGLIDKDGYVDETVEIFEKSLTLAQDIEHLALSLGFMAKIIPDIKLPTDRFESDSYYQVNIFGSGLEQIPSVLFRSKLKANIQLKNATSQNFKVIPVGRGSYYGFTLDGNGRFLLGDYTVTHNTGKTKIVESIMLYKAHICPVAQVFSGSENVNHFYGGRCADITIYNELDTKALENFASRQNIARQYLSNPWAFLILDDVTDDPTILRKKPLGSFMRKLRHWAGIMLNCVQYAMDVPPGMRSCIDYTFILANSINSEREKLYENFASGSIPSYQDFCDLMDQITEDHTALVIDNVNTSSLIQDRVFFYKADLDRVPPNFKVGCADFYAFNDARINKDYRPSFL